jgi:hypothetical protein
MTMRHTVVRYRVRTGAEDQNAELVEAVYRELAEQRPDGFRYATYRLEDGRTFVHAAEWEGDGDVPLLGVAAFREFRAGLDDRCEWGPEVSGAELIGRFDAARPRHRRTSVL